MTTKFDALASLSREHPSPEHFQSFFEQVNQEKNERGAAILLAANVEHNLQFAIERSLLIHTKEQRRKLFNYESPLGSFESLIRVGYAVNIYGKETKDNLDCVKAIRNAFAHTIIPISFNTKQVREICEMMVMPVLLPPVALDPATLRPRSLTKDATPRKRFQEISQAVAHNLFVYAMATFHQFPKFPTEPLPQTHEARVRPRPLL